MAHNIIIEGGNITKELLLIRIKLASIECFIKDFIDYIVVMGIRACNTFIKS
jgi:hypothetical protein